MAYGLELMNSSGEVTLTITDRLSRIVGVYTMTMPVWNGNDVYSQFLSVPGMTTDGTWAIMVTDTVSPFGVPRVTGWSSVWASITTGGINLGGGVYWAAVPLEIIVFRY